jgi:hypothetical protein
MTNSHSSADGSSASSRHPRPRPASKPIALPQTRREIHELRDLLEANLQALKALHIEHRGMLEISLRTIDASATELRHELRAIGSANAPWVAALAESRALLFVALRELIVGDHEAELSMHLPQQEAEPDDMRPHR